MNKIEVFLILIINQLQIMKTTLLRRHRNILLILALCTAGCTVTEFQPETRNFKRTSFLQRAEFGRLVVKPDGSISLEGYKNDGGNEALAAAVKAAVQGAIAGANPAP
jgi:hypothetical protein